ncbi:hypothetical protein F2Q69_00046690 [Brassica cretica]|uniref:Uncharacterized protein n=1 Tax=Brassica cretica TaxID=69181 RepID=A0A8S9PPL5_BRACR|nr:hypothetical protein F2Q69_00046690 [Brassica cretica]
MTTNADKDPQMHDGTPFDANADKTLAGNVSTVIADTAILDQMKEMFASAQKKTDKQGKLVASLAKQVETLTAKARSKTPRGTTRTRSGRRFDFETPGNRAAHADKASSGQNPDETLQPGAQPTAENLPPPTGSNEGEEIERIDQDISDQSDHSDDGADIHPRRTQSQSARQDASFEKPHDRGRRKPLLVFGSVDTTPMFHLKNIVESIREVGKDLPDYNKSLEGFKLYMPSRLARGYVTVRYIDCWVKSVSELMRCEEMQKETTETLNGRNRLDDDDVDVSPKVLSLSQVVQNLEEGFPATRTRSSMRRLANKDKIGELVNSLVVSSSWKVSNYQAHEDDEDISMDEEEDNMTIAQKIRCRRKYSDADKAREDASEPLGKRRRKFQVMEDDDSGPCQKIDSVKIEESNEEYDEITSNIQQKTGQVCDNDEVDETGDTPGKRSMIADEAKKADCWLLEKREKRRCNEKRREAILGRLKQRNLAVKEKELKLEARVMEAENMLEKIREWNTRGNKIKIEASA